MDASLSLGLGDSTKKGMRTLVFRQTGRTMGAFEAPGARRQVPEIRKNIHMMIAAPPRHPAQDIGHLAPGIWRPVPLTGIIDE